MALMSEQGYPITFNCCVCGKEHFLEDMHYNPYDKVRVCDGCFKEYREEQEKEKLVKETI